MLGGDKLSGFQRFYAYCTLALAVVCFSYANNMRFGRSTNYDFMHFGIVFGLFCVVQVGVIWANPNAAMTTVIASPPLITAFFAWLIWYDGTEWGLLSKIGESAIFVVFFGTVTTATGLLYRFRRKPATAG